MGIRSKVKNRGVVCLSWNTSINFQREIQSPPPLWQKDGFLKTREDISEFDSTCNLHSISHVFGEGGGRVRKGAEVGGRGAEVIKFEKKLKI